MDFNRIISLLTHSVNYGCCKYLEKNAFLKMIVADEFAARH